VLLSDETTPMMPPASAPPALPAPAAPVGRRHDIDALRVLAFGLLILYHVGMFYVAGWDWHVKSAYQAEWLRWPMRVVNQWRMPLLFLVSGLAAGFLLRRATPGGFARSRIHRLLLPLAFGMAVVVPPQAYFQALYNGAFEGGYGAFLVHYFTFQPWPPGAFDGSDVGITWNHLWYLPYLLVYSLVLALLLPVLRSARGEALAARFRGLRGWRLWLLPAIPLVIASWALSGAFPTTHDLVADWSNHAQSFPVFLFGYWIGTDSGLWAELRRRRWWLLVGALATFAAFALLLATTTPGPNVPRMLFDVAQRLNTWTWVLLVLAWGHHLLNRPMPWLAYASESVYPWYVLHQTITVAAGYGLARYALGPVVEPVLVLGATALGSVAITHWLVRPSQLLRPLFGMQGAHAARVPHPRAVLAPAGD
jgi:glucans biosynthesis protein C